MFHPRRYAVGSETPHELHTLRTRPYPDNEYPSVLSGSSATLRRDIVTGVQLQERHWQNSDSTILLCTCHQGFGRSNVPETITQSHESWCQHRVSGSAFDNSSPIKLSANPVKTYSDWTNPTDQIVGPSQSDYPTDQPYHSAVDLGAAQMQSNAQNSFVPHCAPRNTTMTNYPASVPLIDPHDILRQDSLTPQLSYVTTPESSTIPDRSYNTGPGMRGVATPNLTTTRGDTVESTKKSTPTSRLTLKSDVDTHFVLGHRATSSGDWLSEPICGQAWTDNLGLQDTQSERQTILSPNQLINSSDISPLQLATEFSNLPPDQTYTRFDNVLNSQAILPTFGPAFASNSWVSTPVSAAISSYPHNLHSPYSAGGSLGVYIPQPSAFSGGFDFNNSPLYPTSHYPAGYTLYGLPQNQSAPQTQTDSASLLEDQPKKVRTTGKAADLDAKLIKWRAEGLTYREIMKKGNWGLEESTLRGRYRTLTKNKEERVRKPTWDNAALSALVAGVDRFALPIANSPRTAEGLDKIPWKKVADWMHRVKGCYLYGNATVKKKYMELVGSHQMQWEVNQWRRANGERPF